MDRIENIKEEIDTKHPYYRYQMWHIVEGRYSWCRKVQQEVQQSGNYKRTANRRDFSLVPPHGTALDCIKEAGMDVIGVGKIGDIFAMAGITETNPTHSNKEGMEVTSEIAKRDFHGLCFVNLVDFDMHYGHRQDAVGYARALSEFDAWLGKFIDGMREDDVVMITADHGCDPADNSTDHTREYVPHLTYGKNVISTNLGTVNGFSYVGREVCALLGLLY